MFKKFKEKYIKNTLIYKLYRIRKTKPFLSNSAFGEEILVNRILNKFKYGFFVDVGAYNPKIGSLTNQLYDKGWKGINIDFSKPNIELFNFLRKRDISINKAISDRKGYVNSYIFDPSSGTNTLEKNYADGWAKNFLKDYSTKKLECVTLTDILDQYTVKRKFEYLNIDVECHDFKVLKGLNLKKYQPKLITCEIIIDQRKFWNKKNHMYYSTLKDVQNSKITKFLENYKYKLISHYYLTSFFISEELQ
tara:strand:+ start:581 stop:1327 length:747 start_codon:yes stop_codon:yes gene_type:complete